MINQQMNMTPPMQNLTSTPPQTGGLQNTVQQQPMSMTPTPQNNASQPMSMTPPPTGGMTATAPPVNTMATQTPGGLQGDINQQRYAPPTPQGQGGNGGGGNMAYSGMGSASQFNPNSAPQNNSVGNFDQYADSALAQAMRSLNPMMEANNNAFEQSMLDRGVQPGSEMYDSQRGNLDRGQNDMLAQALYGAQNQGLAAQQQAWGQQYGYDQLANQLNLGNIGAQASMYGSDASANASMNNASMANQLGWGQLNEQGRQADMNDIFRTQGQDINAALGWANHGLGQQGMDINAFNAQNNANNQWWNQIGGMTNNAPGVNFNPIGNMAGNMQNAGQNMYDAQAAQNQGWGGLLGGLIGMSDERLKDNIELVDTVDGINIYEFDYKNKQAFGDKRYRGVMAQEILKSHPDAVIELNGFYAVDYSKLPVNMEEVKEVA